jgi:Asp-tRNA(Asn)/Glu-tRNA(Gln) amidotransferase A subunit family amidase
MPVGLQLIAGAGREERLLAVALACEKVLGTARQRLGAPPRCVD